VKAIIYQLIELTISEKNFYPSVQTKIWGNIGPGVILVEWLTSLIWFWIAFSKPVCKLD